jgi:hypothetical protein
MHFLAENRHFLKVCKIRKFGSTNCTIVGNTIIFVQIRGGARLCEVPRGPGVPKSGPAYVGVNL